MQLATLCFLTVGDPPHKILLGMKKTGLGEGKFNGYGGKVEDGERIETAVIRELFEESAIQITASQLKKAGVLTFKESGKQDWETHVYVVSQWQGTAVESREMVHHWFTLDNIPYEQMWEDDQFWLPHVLAGKTVVATFCFDQNGKMMSDMEIDIQDE